jgi:hypothetical protein
MSKPVPVEAGRYFGAWPTAPVAKTSVAAAESAAAWESAEAIFPCRSCACALPKVAYLRIFASRAHTRPLHRFGHAVA